MIVQLEPKDEFQMTGDLTLRPKATQARVRQRRLARKPPAPLAGLPGVAMGACAVGPDACKRLLDALPSDGGMAFILVQHLDPAHDSALVALLDSDPPVAEREAEDGMMTRPGVRAAAVEQVHREGDDLLLVRFVDDPQTMRLRQHPMAPHDGSRVREPALERDAMRSDLHGAMHRPAASRAEQQVLDNKAVSIKPDLRSINQELLASKEELQSLNKGLMEINSRLKKSLERQSTTANNLQNVLYSTDVATLFLDRDLKIRFFTPATKALFNIIPHDIGRPLSDLRSLAVMDADLTNDAHRVLRNSEPMDREIEVENGAYYSRRMLPYLTQEHGVEGVVIIFSDVTERRRAADEIGVEKRHAEMSNAAKTRFLAAASHDLRQPLQTLALVQGLLAKNVTGDKAMQLVGRLGETLGAMTGMLNALLDINQIETGMVHAEPIAFPVDGLLSRLRDEFTYVAHAKGLDLGVVPCSLLIDSDPRLLEQMIRNLLANALKYTHRGKVLLGCRRHGNRLGIEIWDSGIGIVPGELRSIFEEYHQIDNPARERARGLGLGLSIVRRLAGLLGHEVTVRSQPGKGSVFSVLVGIAGDAPALQTAPHVHGSLQVPRAGSVLGTVLVIEDDPDVRDLLEMFLRDEGYDVTCAPDGAAALRMVTTQALDPGIILADYNLPNGLNGVETTIGIRAHLHRAVPAIILTGDVAIKTTSDIASQECVRFSKPVKLDELGNAIKHLLPAASLNRPTPASMPAKTGNVAAVPVIYVVDDDASVRGAIRAVLEDDGHAVEEFASCEAFLGVLQAGQEGCLLLDAYLPGMTGLSLLRRLHDTGVRMPTIMITGHSDVRMAVEAMKAGALDFIDKPISRTDLLASVDRALELSRDSSRHQAWRDAAAAHVARLTPRQREIMERVLAGEPSKNIAADLGISQRTVENHRASIMAKMGTKSLPALARLALAATGSGLPAPV